MFIATICRYSFSSSVNSSNGSVVAAGVGTVLVPVLFCERGGGGGGCGSGGDSLTGILLYQSAVAVVAM